MAKRKKPEPLEASYTLRSEQETMLGLPTKVPEQILEELRLAKIAPDVHLQRVVAKYRSPPAPAGQMGFGLSFGAVPQANQLDMFTKAGTAPAITMQAVTLGLRAHRR